MRSVSHIKTALSAEIGVEKSNGYQVALSKQNIKKPSDEGAWKKLPYIPVKHYLVRFNGYNLSRKAPLNSVI